MAKEKTRKVRPLVALLLGFMVFIISFFIWGYIVYLMIILEKNLTFNQQGFIAIALALQGIINFIFVIFLTIILSKDI